MSPIKTAITALAELTCSEGWVKASAQSPKRILIEEVRATTPGNGWGLRTIRTITRILDETQCIAECYLDQDSPTSIDRLRKLYHHFGFRECGFLKMQRLPNPLN